MKLCVFWGTWRHILQHHQRFIYRSMNIVHEEYWTCFLICKLLWSKCSNTGNVIPFGSFRSSKSYCQFLKEMCLPFFTSTTKTHVLLILHGLLLFFSWNWISVCLNNLRTLQSIQKNYWIGWQDLAPHWTYNVIQGWEWRIAWLFCTAVCSLYFSDLSEII